MEKDQVPPGEPLVPAQDQRSDPIPYEGGGTRLTISGTHVPPRASETVPNRMGRAVKWGLAAVAALALLLNNGKTLYNGVVNFFKKPDPAVRVNWLTVQDPTQLRRCVIDKSGFLLATRKSVIPLVDNPCLKDLARLAPPSQAASSTTVSMQQIRASYFLAFENTGAPIDEIRLFDKKDAATPVAMLRTLDKGGARAMCVGYEGVAAVPSRSDAVAEIEVHRRGDSAVRMDIPTKGKAMPVLDSSCGQVEWDYPS